MTEKTAPVLPNSPVVAISAVFECSEGWDIQAWSSPSLVLTQAALKSMLRTVESELGRRGLIAPHRRTP